MSGGVSGVAFADEIEITAGQVEGVRIQQAKRGIDRKVANFAPGK